MARWSDLATWRGPTVNQGGAMREQRGIVVHIAEGTYEGTISWQRNPAAKVSSHFIVGLDGTIAQMVDTDTTAWTQVAGNGHWLSVENAGFHSGQLTAAQVEANAQLLARAHQVYGVPLQLASDPNGRGLGHHAMGGAAWGGHYDCPGPINVALKPAILARAVQIIGGPAPQPKEFDMPGLFAVKGTDPVYISDGLQKRHVPDPTALANIRAAWPGIQVVYVKDQAALDDAAGPDWSTSSGGGTAATVDLTDAAVEKVADAVLDEAHDRLAS